MKECINMLILLAISVASNAMCGIYFNTEKLGEKFEKGKLISGFIKAGCVCASALGISYIIERMPELSSAIGMEPKAMMVGAITIYTGKTVVSLCKILGVSKADKVEQDDDSEYVDM